MAVASGQTQTQSHFGLCMNGQSGKFSNTMNIESSALGFDSDDDYDYVASLAEQIAHAMLDDDDGQEDAMFRDGGIVGCSPFRTSAVDTPDGQATHGAWLCNPKMTGKTYPRRIGDSVPTPVSVPHHRHDSVYFTPSQVERTTERRNHRRDGIILVGSPREAGLQARESGAQQQQQQQVGWGCLPLLVKPLQAAAVPLPLPSSNGVEIPISPTSVFTRESSGTTIHSQNSLTSQTCGYNKMTQTQMRHQNGIQDWQHQARPASNARGHHHSCQRGHRGDTSRGARGGLCRYYVQASHVTTTQWPSPPLAISESAAVQTVFLAGRKETTGTGVFLPRTSGTGFNHRRKTESGVILSKAAQAPRHLGEAGKVKMLENGGYLCQPGVSTEWTY